MVAHKSRGLIYFLIQPLHLAYTFRKVLLESEAAFREGKAVDWIFAKVNPRQLLQLLESNGHFARKRIILRSKIEH